MVAPRPWRPIRGHKWNIPGIYYRPTKPKPFNVGFTRNGRTIYIGSFHRLPAAELAAKTFLENERR